MGNGGVEVGELNCFGADLAIGIGDLGPKPVEGRLECG